MAAYFVRLARMNGLNDPEGVRAVFKPGMGFDAPRKWWGDHGARQNVHEGLDVCFLQGSDGSIHPVGSGFKVPPVQAGTVVRICRDFLGQTLVLSHGRTGPESGELLSLYAHLETDQGLSNGAWVSAEDSLGCIAQSDALPAGMLPHLHISLAWNERPWPMIIWNGPD